MRLRLTERSDVSPNVGYLAGVDHIRGFAAVLMILYHGYQQIERKWFERGSSPFESLIIEGHTAVAMFMVLSGFIFTYGALTAAAKPGADDGGEIRYAPFLRNRALRILPMYVLVVFLAIYTRPEGYTFTGFLQLFTLQATPPIATADLGEFGALTWTISVEFAFYLIFPFLFRFLRRYGPWYLVGLIVAMNLLRLLSAAVEPEKARDISYWTIVGRLDQFLVGMLIGWLLVRRPPVLTKFAAWAGVVLSVVVVIVLVDVFNGAGGWTELARWKAVWPVVEGVIWGGFVVAWMIASRLLPRGLAIVLALPGIVSYSAYLLHYAIVVLIRDHWKLDLADNDRQNALLNTLIIVIPATFALATLTYHLVEKPFMQMRRRYLPAEDHAAP
jgi:peptidoglycan/LPS O-acetylase OafA/YrhL